MPDYILLMHNDTASPEKPAMWDDYLTALRGTGAFQGGSAIGPGVMLRKGIPAAPASVHLTGFIRFHATGEAAARQLVNGNPVYECGGTVELRELQPD